jgi:hypothetical protein
VYYLTYIYIASSPYRNENEKLLINVGTYLILLGHKALFSGIFQKKIKSFLTDLQSSNLVQLKFQKTKWRNFSPQKLILNFNQNYPSINNKSNTESTKKVASIA